MNFPLSIAGFLRVLGVSLAAFGVVGCDLFVSAETRAERAEALIAIQDFRGALIEAKNALQDEPGNARARRAAAEAAVHLGDAQGAEADLRRAIEFGMPLASVSDLAARIRLALGQYGELLTAIDTEELVLPEPARGLYRGRALLGLQRPAEAFEQFSGVLKAAPRLTEAQIGMAQADAGLGRLDEALARLAAVTEREPENASALLIRGNLLAARGQFDAGLEILERARSVDNGQLSAQQQAILLGTLIEVRLSRGDIAAAETALEELNRILPGTPLTRFLGARILLVRQDYPNAAAELQRIVTAAPQFTQARFLLGAVTLAQGRLQQADLHLSQVVQNAPDNLEARKLLAQVRMRLDRPDEAVQVLIPALDTDTTALDPQVAALLGAAQMQAGDGSEEIAVLEAAIKDNPQSPPLHLNLAAAHLRSGGSREALEVLDTEQGRRGGIAADALRIAALAAAQGPAAADAELSRVLKERPDDLDVLVLAAGLLTQRAEFDRGRALLIKALAEAPDHPAALLGMARLESAAGNLAVAEGQLEKLVTLEPGNGAAHLGLADVALRRGDTRRAIERMEAWRMQEPGALEPRFRLARLHLMSNDGRSAGAMLEEAIARSPDAAAGHQRAGALYMDLGRYEQALASFRAAIDLTNDQPLYWLSLAQAQLALDQRAAARESINKALSLRADWVAAVGVATLLDIRDGNRQSAQTRVQALRKQRPRDPTVALLEGDMLLAFEQYHDAARAFDNAFALRPNAVAALKSYRARYQGRLGQVTEPLTRWLAQTPSDFVVRSVLAEAFQLSGQELRAIQEYEIVVRDGPPSAVAFNNLAWLYQIQKDPRAIGVAQRAHELAPNAAPITDTYGWILVQNGRAEEGLRLLEEAVKAAPDIPEIGYHRAAALAQLGRRAEAARVLAALLASAGEFESRGDALRLQAELAGT